MKKLIFILALLLISTPVSARQSKEDIINGYKAELEKCDKAFDKQAYDAFSTADMIKSAYDATHCYEALIHKIIEQKYSKRAEEHKKALTDYMQASYAISNLVYQTTDACDNRCGTAKIVIGKSTAANKTREIVEDYLRALNANLLD